MFIYILLMIFFFLRNRSVSVQQITAIQAGSVRLASVLLFSLYRLGFSETPITTLTFLSYSVAPTGARTYARTFR